MRCILCTLMCGIHRTEILDKSNSWYLRDRLEGEKESCETQCIRRIRSDFFIIERDTPCTFIGWVTEKGKYERGFPTSIFSEDTVDISFLE